MEVNRRWKRGPRVGGGFPRQKNKYRRIKCPIGPVKSGVWRRFYSAGGRGTVVVEVVGRTIVVWEAHPGKVAAPVKMKNANKRMFL